MGGMDWIDVAQEEEGGAFECGNEPLNSVICREFLDNLRTW